MSIHPDPSKRLFGMPEEWQDSPTNCEAKESEINLEIARLGAAIQELGAAMGIKLDLELTTIPVGDSHYVVLQNGRVVREARVSGCNAAYQSLKPDHAKGEFIYLKVGRPIVTDGCF